MPTMLSIMIRGTDRTAAQPASSTAPSCHASMPDVGSVRSLHVEMCGRAVIRCQQGTGLTHRTHP